MAMKKVAKIVKDDKGSLFINDDGTQEYYEGVFAEMAAAPAKPSYQEEGEEQEDDGLLDQYMQKMKVE